MLASRFLQKIPDLTLSAAPSAVVEGEMDRIISISVTHAMLLAL